MREPSSKRAEKACARNSSMKLFAASSKIVSSSLRSWNCGLSTIIKKRSSRNFNSRIDKFPAANRSTLCHPSHPRRSARSLDRKRRQRTAEWRSWSLLCCCSWRSSKLLLLSTENNCLENQIAGNLIEIQTYVDVLWQQKLKNAR